MARRSSTLVVATVVVASGCGAPGAAPLESVPITTVHDPADSSVTTVAIDTVPVDTVPATTSAPTALPVTTAVAIGTLPATTLPATTLPVVTDAPAETVDTAPPLSDPEPIGPEVTDDFVLGLAASLGVTGSVERRDGEHGVGQCIGRLDPQGICINVPTWNIWHYWNLDAQRGGQIEPAVAISTAAAFFEQVGVAPGAVTEVRENGPAREVHYDTGAYVLTTADGVALMIASTGIPDFLPTP